ncbi:Nitrogen assimilation transcription factor nit-4 [Colletotrichum tanaceti]|nr:Nitrogen assimilation transcription factor nit-4 [Colletotrichum tanaceti]
MDDITVQKPRKTASHMKPVTLTHWAAYTSPQHRSDPPCSLVDCIDDVCLYKIELCEVVAPPGPHITSYKKSTKRSSKDCFSGRSLYLGGLQVDPDDTQNKTHLPHVLLLHMQYYQNVIHSHRPWMSSSYIQPQPSRGPGPGLHAPQRMCLESAAAVAKLMRAYELQFSLRSVNVQGVAIVFSAAILLIFASMSRRRGRRTAETTTHLSMCFRALEELSASWDCAKRARDFLLVLHRKWELWSRRLSPGDRDPAPASHGFVRPGEHMSRKRARTGSPVGPRPQSVDGFRSMSPRFTATFPTPFPTPYSHHSTSYTPRHLSKSPAMDNDSLALADDEVAPKTWQPYTHSSFPTAQVGHIGASVVINGEQVTVAHTRPTRLESMKMSCIMDVNNTVVGYSRAALASVGAFNNAHTTTYVSIVQKNTLPMELRIRHVFRTRYKASATSHLMCIPITACVEQPRIEYHEAGAAEQRARLFPDDSTATFADSMRLVVHVRADNIWIRKVGTTNANDNPATQAWVEAWSNSLIGAAEGPVPIQLGFTMSPNQVLVSNFMLPIIQDFDRLLKDPTLAWAEARAFFRDYKNYRQLGWKTLNINTKRPELPNAPQIVFTSDIARILAMQMSSYEELEIDLSNAAKLEALTLNAMFLSDLTSAWSTEDGHMFGINADGTIQSYMVIIPSMTEDQMAFLPDFGQPVKITPNLKVPEPRVHPIDEAKPRLPTLMTIRRLISEAQRLDLEADFEDTTGKTDAFEVRDITFASLLATVLPDTILKEEARFEVAMQLLPKFFPIRADSSAWEDELMQSTALIGLDLSRLSQKIDQPAWSGVRVKAPRHAPLGSVYFIVSTPRESGWPERYQRPPMSYRIPHVNIAGTWEDLINGAQEQHFIPINILAEPDDATTRAEMMAMTAAAQALPDSSCHMLWQYTKMFKTDHIVDATSLLPLADFIPTEDPSPYSPLHAALHHLPAGLLAYTGGPGSGKTTFSIRLLHHVLTRKETARAVWTVHSNELSDDIATKLGQVLPAGIVVSRVYPLQRMIKAIAGRTTTTVVPSVTRNLSAAARNIADAISGQLAKQHLRDDSLRRSDSLVTQALRVAQANPAFVGIITLRQKPILTKQEDKMLTESIYRLLAATMAGSRVLVGTPVALGQIGNCTKLVTEEIPRWKTNIIVVDEAGRMPEAQVWIPVAAFPTDIVIMMGNTRQFRPMSKSLDNQGQGPDGAKWHSTFGPQRAMPLLRRAEKFAATVHHIRINRRNIGQIATWAKWNVYNGRMNIAYEKSPLVNLFREIVGAAIRLPQTRSNSVIVNVGEGVESATKPNYTNEANRNYIFHLIFRLFRAGFPCTTDVTSQGSIMVITPYSAQLAAYQNEWNKYIVDDYMRRNVTFKTVDDSMSAEADIVILDTVRTEKFGFVPATPRMGVATTRARGGMITILNVADPRYSISKEWMDNDVLPLRWTRSPSERLRFCPMGFTCHPGFQLRSNRPKPASNPSVTPGPAPQIENDRLLPTARRTRAQILAGTVEDTNHTIDVTKVPEVNVSDQMRAAYRMFKTATTGQTDNW